MSNEDRAKQLADDALAELQAELNAGRSETLVRFLDCLSRFHQYSWKNCMLIAIQKPDATRVAGFRKWLELKRYVRKGEKGIAILAPMTYRKKVEDENGDEETQTRIRGFKVVHVFDVSQTEGEPLAEFAQITGEPIDLIVCVETLIRGDGIELRYETLPQGTDGVSEKGAIVISDSLTGAERFAVLVHEYAHELMHDIAHRKETTKTIRETEAEAVAYAVCRAFGMDCSTRSSDYIQLYQGDAEVLMQSMERIQTIASGIISDLRQASKKHDGKIRLGCRYCDRDDYDRVTKIPIDWTDVVEVQSIDQALESVNAGSRTCSLFQWQTHLGVCPNCAPLHK